MSFVTVMKLSHTRQGKLVTRLILDNFGPVHSIGLLWNLSVFGGPPLPCHHQIVGHCLLYMFRAWHSVGFKIKILWDCICSKHIVAASIKSETE